MKQDLVIGLDCSTTACKVIIWDLNGIPVAQGRASLEVLSPQPGWHEQPATGWWDAVVSALRSACAQVDGRRLAGLCITPQRETFVPVDQTDQPLRNAILWMDERARPLLPWIEAEIGRERFHHITGKPLSGNLSVAKIAWLRQHEPQVFTRTARFLDVTAYLHHRLIGEYNTGWGCADPMGLFDMRQAAWSDEILAFCGLHAGQFATAFPPGEVIGRINPAAASITGLPGGLPVVAGVGDGQAAGLGSGIIQPGWAYLSLGTSAITGICKPVYQVDRAYRTLYCPLPGSYTLETALLSGTYLVDWFVEAFLGKAGEAESRGLTLEIVSQVALDDVPPGTGGLVLVPYWNSAMSPYWDATAAGLVIGWRGYHRREHLLRAIFEGVAYELRLHLEGLESALDRQVEGYIASGGGAQNSGWCQLISDVTGRPVARLLTSAASALGAGIQAACAVGLFPSFEHAAAAMVHLAQNKLLPDPERHTYYSRLYQEIYRPLYPALRDVMGRLASLSEDSRLASTSLQQS